MKRFLLITLLVVFFSGVYAQLTPGNIVVVRVGDGTNSINNSAHVTSILEYTNAGVATGNTITFPSGSTGIRLTQSGTTISEGEITVSQNGNYLTVAGYDAQQGLAMVNTSATNPNGVIGLIDINNIGTPNLSYQFLRNSTVATSAGYYQGAFRSAVSNAGSEFWGSGTQGSGTGGGVRYQNSTIPSGGTQVSTTITTTRVIQIVAGDLFVSANSGTIRIGKVGTGGLPVTTGNTISNIPGTAISNLVSPYSFIFFDRDPAISGYDLLYVTDDGFGPNTGILKFYFDGTNWQSAGAVWGTNTGSPSYFRARGLGGYIDCNGNVQLFVTIMTAGGLRPSQLYRFTDNTLYNSNISSNNSNLVDVLTSPYIDYSLSTVYKLGSVTVVSKPKLLIRTSNSIPSGDYGDIYVKTGATATLTGNITIAGTLTVESGATLDAGTYTISTSSTNNDVAGVFVLSNGATLRTANVNGITASAASGTVQTCIRTYGAGANYEYTGAAAQVTGNGLPANLSGTLRINNSSGLGTNGVTLSQPTVLSGTLNLTSGKLTTTATELLSLTSTASVLNASSTSFINGPLKKVGNSAFTFPVGKGGIYAPIGISGGTGSAVSDEFTAEYLRTNPQSVYGNNYGASGINHVSYVEYWSLERNVGTATKVIALDVHQTSFCLQPSSTFVSQYNGTQWTNEPSTPSGFAACGSYQCGTITSNAAISSFGALNPFTLATTDPFAINPLPIKLISFNAQKVSNSLSFITWEIAECCSKDARFELERSMNSRDFATITTINGSETNRFYSYNDSRLQKGTNYYRLKMADVDGTVKYSKVVAIVNDDKGFVITSIAPNPVQDIATVTISAAKQGGVDFKVYDLSGTVVKQWHSNISEGSNTISMNVVGLAAGTYHVLASSPDTRSVFRFIKQ